MMRDQPSLVKSVAVAVAAVLAAWVLRLLLMPILGTRVPFITFFPIVFVVAWWGGWRPTILATLFGSLVLVYGVLEPLGSIAIATPEYRFGLAIFAAVALGVGWLGEKLHAARWAAQQAGERALAEHERLRVTLASIGDAVIVTDEQGHIHSLNSVAESLTGWNQRDAVGRPLAEVFQIVNEETHASVEDPCAKVLRTGAVVGLANHTVLIAQDGVERPIDDSAAPILDEQGRTRGVIVVFRDTTEKRRAERALRHSEQELADFFDNANVPLHSVGPDGIILRVNQAELDLLGYTREEVIGHHVAEFHAEQRIIDDILARLSRGEEIQDYKSRLRCKDGSCKDVLITSTVRWEDGQFLYSRCFTRDVTDQQQAEEALAFIARASNALAALVDRESALQQAVRLAVPYLADWSVVYVVDDRGEIDYHAHAHAEPEQERLLTQMLSMSPLDWSSNTATVRALRTGQSQLMETLPQAFLDSVAQSDEHRAILRQLHPHAVIAVPLRIRDRTIGVLGLVSCDPARRYTRRDLKLAESFAERVATAVDNSRLFHAVKEANRQKDEFLAMLAHELRNPLASIRYAVALGQMSPAESLNELFEIIDRQTQNLARLIDDLLDVSRITGDKITLRKEHIDAATIANRAVATVRPLIEQRHHELVLEIDAGPMPLLVDATRAEQIVANLLTNAAKYTKDGGRITVRAFSENEHAVIEVSDTGVGMPPEMLGRVFDLFTQADRTLDRSEGGLGIGLTIARKLAEMHGGSISAASAGLGRGATFTLRLPLAAAPSSERELPAADSQLEESSKLRILVVDDNRDTAKSCAMLLRILGHQVQIAFDGIEAVKKAREFKPQVLLLDIGLPGMSGYDVARKLRDDGFQNELMVAISGYGQADDRRRSLEAGFDHHLVKPIDQSTLRDVLRQVPAQESIAG